MYVYTYIYMYAHIHINTHMNNYVHTIVRHTHTHTHIHTYTHACTSKTTSLLNVMQGGSPCTGCASSCGLLTASSGTLTDGEGNYANNAECLWKIAPAGASWVTLSFEYVDTESLRDNIRVYRCPNADCTTREILAELSGMVYTTQSFISTSGNMLVWFTSSPADTSLGFAATWASNALPSVSVNDDEAFRVRMMKSSAL
jgi:hypothetical protein